MGVDNLRTIVSSEKWKRNDPHKHGEAVEVLRRFNASLTAEADLKRDAREEETLSIAKRANRIALAAAISAIIAAIAAIISAIITITQSP